MHCSRFRRIDDVDLATVEPCGGFRTHLEVWKAGSARDVPGGVCVARAGVDHDDFGDSSFEVQDKSHESV
jgi:hypothetical protein